MPKISLIEIQTTLSLQSPFFISFLIYSQPSWIGLPPYFQMIREWRVHSWSWSRRFFSLLEWKRIWLCAYDKASETLVNVLYFKHFVTFNIGNLARLEDLDKCTLYFRHFVTKIRNLAWVVINEAGHKNPGQAPCSTDSASNWHAAFSFLNMRASKDVQTAYLLHLNQNLTFNHMSPPPTFSHVLLYQLCCCQSQTGQSSSCLYICICIYFHMCFCICIFIFVY